MSLLDIHLAKTLIAQTEPNIQEQNFKAAPSDVYQKRAPNNMLPQIKDKNYEDQTQLDKINPNFTVTGEYIAIAAKELREFEEALKLERDKLREAQDAKKSDFGYMDKMRDLETNVQTLGNAILAAQEQSGITARKLYRMQQHWLYVQRDQVSTTQKPNELEALMQVLKENLSEKTVQKLIAEKNALMKSLAQVTITITKTLQVSPIKEDHTDNTPRMSILQAQMQGDVSSQILALADQFNSFAYEVSIIDSALDQVLPNNVTQLSDAMPEAAPIAASRNVQ
jgi:glycyl-tRNA synthetase (class II)